MFNFEVFEVNGQTVSHLRIDDELIYSVDFYDRSITACCHTTEGGMIETEASFTRLWRYN